MKCNWSNVSLGWRSGSIDNMTKEAIKIAELLDTKVNFEFNSVTVNVSKHSGWKDVTLSVHEAVQAGKTSAHGKGV